MGPLVDRPTDRPGERVGLLLSLSLSRSPSLAGFSPLDALPSPPRSSASSPPSLSLSLSERSPGPARTRPDGLNPFRPFPFSSFLHRPPDPMAFTSPRSRHPSRAPDRSVPPFPPREGSPLLPRPVDGRSPGRNTTTTTEAGERARQGVAGKQARKDRSPACQPGQGREGETREREARESTTRGWACTQEREGGKERERESARTLKRSNMTAR